MVDAIERGIRRSCATNSATCCSRSCSTRAWPRSAAGSTLPASRAASPTSWCAAIRMCSAEGAGDHQALAHVGGAQGGRTRGARRRGRAGRCAAGAAGPEPRGQAGQARCARGLRLARRDRRARQGRRGARRGGGGRGGRRRHRDRRRGVGDLLFAVANWARHLQAGSGRVPCGRPSARFERRFSAMEPCRRGRRQRLEQLDAAAWDALWNAAKREERAL